jgi:hypothetical protein
VGGGHGSDWLLSPSADLHFSDLAAMEPMQAAAAVPLAGWLQILFAAGAFEATAYHRQYNVGGKVPGDYGCVPPPSPQRARAPPPR